MRISFRRTRRTGLGSPHESFVITVSGKEVGRIQETGRAWFWYADGVNTCNRPVDLASAKQEVRLHYIAKKRLS